MNETDLKADHTKLEDTRMIGPHIRWIGILKRLLGLAFVGLFFVAAANDDEPVTAVTFLLIVFGAILLSSFGRPKPVGIEDDRTRKDVLVPAYVENLIVGRWIVLVGGGLITAISQSEVLWAISIAAFILMTEYASRKYYREDPVNWEIAFHNEVDGYSNGDGDGDGD